LKIPKFFRGDAAFASPKQFRLLEAESYWYAIRLKANAVLERQIAHLMKRPVGRPSKKPKVIYHSFRYQAKSWDRARRVVAKIEWHAGELFPQSPHLRQQDHHRGQFGAWQMTGSSRTLAFLVGRFYHL
jgi:hypothetical protein